MKLVNEMNKKKQVQLTHYNEVIKTSYELRRFILFPGFFQGNFTMYK